MTSIIVTPLMLFSGLGIIATVAVIVLLWQQHKQNKKT